MIDDYQEPDEPLAESGFCRDCKHWAPDKETDSRNVAHLFGVCARGVGAVSQYPEADGCIGDGRPEDGTGDGRSGPVFGCVLFQPNAPTLTERQLEIIHHAIGAASGVPGYRNHYCTGPGSDAYDDCEEMVRRGVMSRHEREWVPYSIYKVVDPERYLPNPRDRVPHNGQWVSVEEELPEEGEWVLHTYAGVRKPEYGRFSDGKFWREEGPAFFLPTTHWLFVPMIPEAND